MPERTRTEDQLFMRLMRSIVRDDKQSVAKLLATTPLLARQRMSVGATRNAATDFFFEEIRHYLYAGDTPLHAAAAGYRLEIARMLIEHGADVQAANRRGAQPLHYAADGVPGSRYWNPEAQAKVIALLMNAGADANALDKSGVTPLHRAVRQRCVAAVDSLLRNGSDVRLKNKNGSTPMHLAVQNTGRGGTGSRESRALQKDIIGLLLSAGASLHDRDARGRTVHQAVQSDWIRPVLRGNSL
ncbi:MAG TPA: ankyrin repeat domain-containing protein [Terriglobales bacterium]|nr:ankyrin repeat domain-containing protein [Terriglobales bacterium]